MVSVVELLGDRTETATDGRKCILQSICFEYSYTYDPASLDKVVSPLTGGHIYSNLFFFPSGIQSEQIQKIKSLSPFDCITDVYPSSPVSFSLFSPFILAAMYQTLENPNNHKSICNDCWYWLIDCWYIAGTSTALFPVFGSCHSSHHTVSSERYKRQNQALAEGAIPVRV